MADRSYPRLRRPLAVVAGLACAAWLLTGSHAAGSGTGEPLRVLQLNLCDSGIAGCYTGRSIAEAAAVLRAETPDLVTLNEVCRDDVSALGRTLADRGGVASAFQPAVDRRTGGPFRCRNGQPYGIGLLVRVDGRYTTTGGGYPVQDGRDPEERVWLCLSTTGRSACTTHLASTSRTVALAQCRYLLDKVIPRVPAPAVLAGDLNLRYGGVPDVRSCVPSGYLRMDDGAVQHVVATPDFTAGSSRSIDMDGATDHPGLLVTLTIVGQ
jgi:endonuclease/exonuclease/phosphatase family metal-dependent hydrolase